MPDIDTGRLHFSLPDYHFKLNLKLIICQNTIPYRAIEFIELFPIGIDQMIRVNQIW